MMFLKPHMQHLINKSGTHKQILTEHLLRAFISTKRNTSKPDFP